MKVARAEYVRRNKSFDQKVTEIHRLCKQICRPFSCRIGLTTSYVVQVLAGNDLEMSVTALGNTEPETSITYSTVNFRIYSLHSFLLWNMVWLFCCFGICCDLVCHSFKSIHFGGRTAEKRETLTFTNHFPFNRSRRILGETQIIRRIEKKQNKICLTECIFSVRLLQAIGGSLFRKIFIFESNLLRNEN